MLGRQNFNRSAVYTQVDPPKSQAEQLKVDLLPTSFLDAIDRSLEEWEQRDDDDQATEETLPSDPN